MSDAIRNWLPITKRNRVALGFAFAALVMFVTWNLLPMKNIYEGNKNGIAATVIWQEVTYRYYYGFNAFDFYEVMSRISRISLLFNGLIVLILVPLWKILHSHKFIRISIALINLLGAFIIFKYYIDGLEVDSSIGVTNPYVSLVRLLISLTMFTVFIAMLIFKSELALRYEREVKKMMDG